MHYGTQEQNGKLYGLFSKSCVVQRAKHDLYRLPPRPGMLPRCPRFNQCIGVDLVDLEVRDGTSAKALNVVCWGTGLQIVQPLWTTYTAKTVMKEFKIAWVKHYGWPEIIVHDQGPEFMGNEFQNPAGAAGVLTIPIDSQSPWQNGKTERAGQSFKHQLWDLDEECHIEGETEFEAAVAECCDARNRYCNRSGFSAHQRVFGSSLRLPGSLLSDDPIDRQLLTADLYINFHEQMKCEQQLNERCSHKILHVRYKPQDWHVTDLSREKHINAGDTTMVWRNNNLTGRKGWTGPGVVVAVSPTKTSFWISMRGCLLKCSSEQVRKATDAEWLGAELSKTLATELLKSRQRSGQRGCVDVEVEGQPNEEPPADTRPDVNQILEAVVPAPSVLAPIPEESDSMETEVAGSGPEIRPRQPESEPGSEPVDRNVRPRLATDQEVTQLDEVENSQSTTQTRRDLDQTPDEVPVENLSGAASSIPLSLPLVSASKLHRV